MLLYNSHQGVYHGLLIEAYQSYRRMLSDIKERENSIVSVHTWTNDTIINHELDT